MTSFLPMYLAGLIGGLIFTFVTSLAIFGFLRLVFISDLEATWRDKFGDPLLQFAVYLLQVANWNVVLGLLYLATASVLFNHAVAMFPTFLGRITSRAFWEMSSTASTVSEVRERLRGLFSNDTEKIALYEAQIGNQGTKASGLGWRTLGFGGCLLGVIWIVIMLPVTLSITVGILDAILRLFVQRDGTVLTRVLGTAGAASVPGVPATAYGFVLQERSWTLAFAFVVMGAVVWLLRNISISGWTLPRWKSGLAIWLSSAVTLVISWLAFEAALLIYLICVIAVETCVFLAVTLFVSPMMLSIRGWRQRRRDASSARRPSAATG